MDEDYIGPPPARPKQHWKNFPLSRALGQVIDQLWKRGRSENFDRLAWGRLLDKKFPDHQGSRDPSNKRTYEELLGFVAPGARQNNTGIYVNPGRAGYQGLNLNQIVSTVAALKNLGYIAHRQSPQLKLSREWIIPFQEAEKEIEKGIEADIAKAQQRAAAADSTQGATSFVRPIRCIGRDEEGAVLIDLLAKEASSCMIVHGAPGIGKTTITADAANHQAVISRFGPRRFFVRLESATSAGELCNAIAKAADIALTPRGAIREVLTALGDGPALFILDNLETPWEAAKLEVEQELLTLGAAPDIAILATMRGNDLPAVPSWSLRLQLNPLSTEAAKAIFLEIAPRISERDPDLEPLLRELGGVPLAIELIALEAQRFDHLSEVLQEWKRVGTALAQRDGTPVGKATSLAHSIELSVNSGSRHAGSKKLLTALAEFPSGFDKELCRRLTGEAFYAVVRDILGSGLAYEADDRICLLPPIRRYLWDTGSLTEADLHKIITYYMGSIKQTCTALAGIKALEVKRHLLAEDETLTKVLAYMPHRANLDAIFDFCAQLHECATTCELLLKSKGGYFAATRWMRAASDVLKYIALRACVHLNTRLGKYYLNASFDCDDALVKLTLDNCQNAIDELRASIPDFNIENQARAYEFVATMQADLDRTRAIPEGLQDGSIALPERLQKYTSSGHPPIDEADPAAVTRALFEPNEYVLYLRRFGSYLSFGVEEIDVEYARLGESLSEHWITERLEEAFGATHPLWVWYAHSSSDAHATAGNYEDALKVFRRIEACAADTIYAGAAATKSGLAAVLNALGQTEEANRLAKEAEISEALMREFILGEVDPS